MIDGRMQNSRQGPALILSARALSFRKLNACRIAATAFTSGRYEGLMKPEDVLDGFFDDKKRNEKCLPPVQEVAARLNVSPGCLRDVLRTQTEQNKRQHIHARLLEKQRGF